jgi:RNA polymerase-binding transcription factor DksA
VATSDTERITARLETRLEEIARMRVAMRRAGEGMTESELADVDNHPADSGTELHERELDATTEILLEEEEQRIEEARRALRDGSYGTCWDCGAEIPADRLGAMPEAVRCVDCQRHFEGLHRQQARA